MKKVFKDTSDIKINATKVCPKFKLYIGAMLVFLLLKSSLCHVVPHPVDDRSLPRCCRWLGSHCNSKSHNNRLASPYDKSICKSSHASDSLTLSPPRH